MMKYKPRPGIVMVRICGENLLVPTREASEACPHVILLPLMAAALWEELEKGRDAERLSLVFQKLSKKPKEEVDRRIEALLVDLKEKGYVLKVEDE